MSKALAGYIRACLDRAAAAERMALREKEPMAKAELAQLASGWRKAAADYQFVEKLDNFLKVYKAPKGPQSMH